MQRYWYEQREAWRHENTWHILVLIWGLSQKAIFDTQRPSGFEGLCILGKKSETKYVCESENSSTASPASVVF